MTSPVSFLGAKIVRRIDKKDKAGLNALNDETLKMQKPWQEGLNLPKCKIKSIPGSYIVEYKLKGDPADFDQNPLTEKHLDNLFNNLFILDRNQIYHSNLSKDNVLFDNDDKGSVQLNSLSYADNYKLTNNKQFSFFDKEENERSFFPSNADSFEWMNFCQYVDNIESYRNKYFAIEDYLSAKSSYHRKRAMFLERSGFDKDDKALRSEIIKEEVFKNPSNSLIRYTNDKFRIYNKRLQADNNYNNDENPIVRFASILDLFYSAKELIDLKQKALNNQNSTKDIMEKEYYKYELEIVNSTLQTVLEEAFKKADANFKGENYTSIGGLYLGNSYDNKLFVELFDEIEAEEDDIEKGEKIYDIITYYNNLIEDWDFVNNSHYKKAYQKHNIKTPNSAIVRMPALSGHWVSRIAYRQI